MPTLRCLSQDTGLNGCLTMSATRAGWKCKTPEQGRKMQKITPP